MPSHLSMQPLFRWAIASMLLICFSCNNSEPAPTALTPEQAIAAQIDTLKTNAQEGDLIVRLNDDLLSEIIKQLAEKDKTFSHAGIIVIRNQQKFVRHIFPNNDHRADTMLTEPLDSFINPQYNLMAGLYRYDFSAPEKTAFLQQIEQYQQEHIHFDKTFDLASDTAMYCSEMIAKSLQKATNNRIHCGSIFIPKKLVPLLQKYFKVYHPTYEQIAKTPFVAIENLYLIPQCTEIIRTKLKYLPQ